MNEQNALSTKLLVRLVQTGFTQRLENLENLQNESGHGKVMEHDILAKSHRIL